MTVPQTGRKVHIPWAVVIALLIAFFPAGLAVLYKKVSSDPSCTGGSVLLAGLGILCLAMIPVTLGGALSASPEPNAQQRAVLFIAVLLFAVMGLLSVGFGIRQWKRMRDYQRMTPYLLGHVTTSMEVMAEQLHMPYHVVSRKLQKLIDCGYLGNAYIHHTHRWFVFGKAWMPVPPPPEEKEEEEETTPVGSDAAFFLSRIRQINESMPKSILTNKIYQIEGLAAKIFQVVEQKPEKKPQIRSFMNYYLPATLKLLDTYHNLQQQRVRGEKIDAVLKKTEDAVDALVEAFKKQLDRLFADEVLDISTDIKVMEGMLAKDGLVSPFDGDKKG